MANVRVAGLVREEFFAAGTPLVCSTAGGLRDRVINYNPAHQSGESLLFSSHTHSSLLAALQRAVTLYADVDHYAALRRNAHASARDIDDTAWHWRCELQRLLACKRTMEGEGYAWRAHLERPAFVDASAARAAGDALRAGRPSMR